MDRNIALKNVHNDPYIGGKETYEYCLKKLSFTHDEFEKIMNEKPKLFIDYKSYYSIIRLIEKPILWGTKIGVIPDTVYRKFFKFNI